jgi:uncharacterized cupin superfamily protein
MAETPHPPALDPAGVPARSGSGYPEPFRAPVIAREWQALGDALGLRNFGVNLVRLPPGATSSQRHWHTRQDEFVWIVAGKVTLITDGGAQVLGPGMCAGFPAGKPDGHHFVNKTDSDVVFLVVGDRLPGDEGRYSDVDLAAVPERGRYVYTRKDGTPY